MSIQSINDNDKMFAIAKFVYRFGLGALLLTNGIVAFVEPESFEKLLSENVIGSMLPYAIIELMVMFAGVNDLILGALVISGKYRVLVSIWIGLWFATISIVKIMNMIVTA